MNTLKTILTIAAVSLSLASVAQTSNTVEVPFAPTKEENKTSIVLSSANLLEIHNPAVQKDRKVVVKIYDAKEKEIFAGVYEEYESFTKRISLSNLNTGDYIVEVSNGFARTIQKVFVR
jgi:hypothetical protein